MIIILVFEIKIKIKIRCIYLQKPGPKPAALAFKNHRPGQKPPQAKHKGLAWPGFFWPSLAWLLASGRNRHITSGYLDNCSVQGQLLHLQLLRSWACENLVQV